MELRIWQVDAFAEKAFEGNPAAVVPLTSWLSDELMHAFLATGLTHVGQQLETFGEVRPSELRKIIHCHRRLSVRPGSVFPG